MNYFDNSVEYTTRGIDYDLHACLEYNPQNAFNVDDIASVLAVYEGQNDSTDWRWLIQLKDNQFVYLRGGCDYTGWDCQSWASGITVADIKAVVRTMLNDSDNNIAVQSVLILQLIKGSKDQTWHERLASKFGL